MVGNGVVGSWALWIRLRALGKPWSDIKVLESNFFQAEKRHRDLLELDKSRKNYLYT